MRSKRTDRQSLKRALASLEQENAALRSRLTAQEGIAPPPASSASTSAPVALAAAPAPNTAASPLPVPAASAPNTAVTPPAPEAIAPPPAVPLVAGGYPTRAAPRTAKTLKEAKEILMNSGEW